jgi:alkanesulfonate monooxygenase SsuD/methylene tetrahydromethanopterin reductase-like flavin-dependent oxidoreductase (luciferase family)
VKLGLHLPNFASLSSPADLADLAARAEAAGWDGFFIWDHVARPEGTFPMAEPWIALAAIGVATQRLRIGPLITPLARRRPWNVARQVASLDELTGGRVTLGVGLGISSGPEFNQFSEESDPRVRGDMLDEGLEILRAAWQGTPVRHAGTHYRVDDVTFLPVPVQPRVPIWGATERLSGRPVRRAAGLDGVFPIGLQPSDLPVLLDNVAQHRPEGLDGYDVVITGTDDSVTNNSAAWRDAGATWWLHELSWRRPLSESVAIIEAGPPAL